MSELRFQKMHGLGNDFVVVDRRAGRLTLDPDQIRRIADRRFGVGCDQVLSIEPSERGHAFMRVWNADGSSSAACGNGTRCVGRLLMEESGRNEVVIETEAGLLKVRANLKGYTVDMGRPRFGWDEIPLAREMDTLELNLAYGPLDKPVAVNIGNPHAVFFVADVDAIPLEELGPALENDPIFPERANIGVAEVRDEETIRLRVFERGAGLTAACGSGACAALVAAARRGIAGHKATIILDSGRLQVQWTEQGRVLMTGPASLSYTGELAPELLAVA
jgi:diaminopimelate epimerase